MKKLKSNRGETLIESLAGILIVTLVFVFLCSAIVSAARSNKQIRSADLDFSYADMVPSGNGTMQVVEVAEGYGIASSYPIQKFETDPNAEASGGTADPDYQKPIYRYYRMRPQTSQEVPDGQ